MNIKRRCLRTLFRIFELASYVPSRKNSVVAQLPQVLPFLLSQAFLPYTVDNGYIMSETLPLLVIGIYLPGWLLDEGLVLVQDLRMGRVLGSGHCLVGKITPSRGVGG